MREKFSKKDLPASALEVELGGDYLPWGTVKVHAVVAPPCGYRGGHGDIAVLVLARKLIGLTMMPARLGEPPTMGELIDPVGFGRCPLSTDGVHRIRRAGGAVEQSAPARCSPRRRFVRGDSGGPRAQSSDRRSGRGGLGVDMDDDEERRPQHIHPARRMASVVCKCAIDQRWLEPVRGAPGGGLRARVNGYRLTF